MPHKFDNSIASKNAVKREQESKGLGNPNLTGEKEATQIFREAPVTSDASDGPPEPMKDDKNHHSAGTDSAVCAAMSTGTMEIESGVATANVPPGSTDADTM